MTRALKTAVLAPSYFLLGWLLVPTVGDGADLYVITGGDGGDIQEMIDLAETGDTVVVPAGVYTTPAAINFRGKAITVRSEGGLVELRMSENPSNPDRASVVIFENQEAWDSVLQGVLLTGGQGTAGRGGGVSVINGSSPTLINCRISGNSATYGGGMYIADGSSPVLENCTIVRNSATVSGGGIRCSRNATPTLNHCTISANWADFGGGGLYLFSGSSAKLTNCSILWNMVENHAGGMYLRRGSNAVLENCTILGNCALDKGGGVYCSDSAPELKDCVISRNVALTNKGGGMYCREKSSPELMNCLISGNAAGEDGGGMYVFESSTPKLTNCLISGNRAVEDGGGMYCKFASAPDLMNCTISGNSGGGVFCEDLSAPKLTNTIVWGNRPESACGTMERTITEDPFFVNPGLFDFDRWEPIAIGKTIFEIPDFVVEVPDYHVRPGSPAIDSGTTAGAPPFDMVYEVRPCALGIDLGVYESGECSEPPDFTRSDVNDDGIVDVADSIAILGHLFRGEPAALSCEKSADVNDDNFVDVTDSIYLLTYLFLPGAEAPAEPFFECGQDSTPDMLDCDLSSQCVSP